MSVYYKCDGPECDADIPEEDYSKRNWIHSSDYDTDFCSSECSQKWFEQFPED